MVLGKKDLKMNSYALLVSSLVLAISAIVVAMIIGRAKSSSGSAIQAEIDPEKLLGPIREQIGVIVRRLDETSTVLTETRTSISQELSNVLTVSQEVRGKNAELALTTERIYRIVVGTDSSIKRRPYFLKMFSENPESIA